VIIAGNKRFTAAHAALCTARHDVDGGLTLRQV
jgi:hypothetical protein